MAQKSSKVRAIVESTNIDEDLLNKAQKLVAAYVVRGDLVVEKLEIASGTLDELGPITRHFFALYPSIKTKNGGCRLSTTEIQPSTYAKGYLSIGNSEDWDIVQFPGQDKVYVLEGSEKSESEFDISFQTLYHFLLNEI